MSSFDKTVKLACKPKAAPPKAKYLDPLIAATWSDEGAVSDICKALAPRFREPNAIVVFKALIVLHTIIRNGSTDNVLSYLSSSDALRLRNVSAGSWDGYAAPQNLQNYSKYLDTRIRAYRDLKHDAIRVQSENNRDMRNSMSIEEDWPRAKKDKQPPKTNSNGPQRSKTMMGRKLGSMTVEKGLLRETRIVQKMIDAVVECRFYLDDLEDELTLTALRVLVKDLLILVQACNEGVINVLERYFEMSHVDAKQALELYRHFCKQTGLIEEYLGVAKKLQNLLNISIPTLKSAPNSLAGALQEYLDDPNFEQNRIEYKTAKAAAEGNARIPMPKKPDGNQPQHQAAQTSASTVASTPPQVKIKEKDVIDFFAAIEETSSPQTNSAVTASGPHNPFTQMTLGNVQQAPQFAVQPMGQVLPQHTAFPLQSNPFGVQSLQQLPGQQAFSPFIPSQPTALPQTTVNLGQGPSYPFSQPQPTGMPQLQQQQMGQMTLQQPSTDFPTSQLRPQAAAFLQSQATGANPFRQSTILPQSTGMALFGVGVPNGPGQSNPNPFGTFNAQTGPAFNQSQSAGAAPTFSTSFSASTFAPTQSFPQQNTPSNLPPRPASTPLTTIGSTSTSTPFPPQAQPVQSHQTGSKNPFGPVIKTPPPVPRAPTLMELAMNKGAPATDPPAGRLQVQPAPYEPIVNTSSFAPSALSPGATDMSSVASTFSFSNKSNGVGRINGVSGLPNAVSQTPLGPKSATSPTQTNLPFSSTLPTQPTGAGSTTSSLFSSALSTQQTPTTSYQFSSTLSTQPTGATSASSPSVPPVPIGLPPVKSHLTGFAGLKPFKPTSSFGAALLESLPAIPDNAPAPPTNFQTNASSPISPVSTTSPVASSQQASFGTLNSRQPNLGGFQSQTQTGFGGPASSGSTVGQGLRPQMTGGGASNPFRASAAVPAMTGVPSLPSFTPSNGFAASFPSFIMSGPQSMGANLFGSGGNGFMNTTSSQPQQQSSQSLI